jgi:hypothetical protein
MTEPNETDDDGLRVYEDDFGISRVEGLAEFNSGEHVGRYLRGVAQCIAEQEDGLPLDEICRGFVQAIYLKRVAEDARP